MEEVSFETKLKDIIITSARTDKSAIVVHGHSLSEASLEVLATSFKKLTIMIQDNELTQPDLWDHLILKNTKTIVYMFITEYFISHIKQLIDNCTNPHTTQATLLNYFAVAITKTIEELENVITRTGDNSLNFAKSW